MSALNVTSFLTELCYKMDATIAVFNKNREKGMDLYSPVQQKKLGKLIACLELWDTFVPDHESYKKPYQDFLDKFN